METLEQLMDSAPAYAKDLRLNLSTLMQQPELTPRQAWGTAVASAIASRNARLTRALTAKASETLTEQEMEGARSAAALMGMNNVYYRFLHLTSNAKYATIPARLRMNAMRTHGIDPVDFELYCTAASAIKGCGACVDSHEKVLREKGVPEETITAAIRIASVIHGLATVFDAESAK